MFRFQGFDVLLGRDKVLVRDAIALLPFLKAFMELLNFVVLFCELRLEDFS